jgi:hypothetical protein
MRIVILSEAVSLETRSEGTIRDKPRRGGVYRLRQNPIFAGIRGYITRGSGCGYSAEISFINGNFEKRCISILDEVLSLSLGREQSGLLMGVTE